MFDHVEGIESFPGMKIHYDVYICLVSFSRMNMDELNSVKKMEKTV